MKPSTSARPFAGAALAAALLMTAACSHAPSIQEKALTAYKAGDYAAALPLLKKWAADPHSFVDGKPPREVMAYIIDCQMKLKPPVAAATATAPAVAAAKPPAPLANPSPLAPAASVLPPIPGTSSSSSSLDAQAMAVGAAQGGTDIPMGADRIPHKPYTPGQVLVTTIKELANFNYDPVQGGDIPPDVQALDGAKVRVTGFMIPLTQAEDITTFALVPSLVSCCFGQPPGVQHVFTCTLPKGRTVQYSVDQIEVEGILHIHIQRQDGYTSSIFDMDVSSVKTAE